jgi:hypothetical protein
MLIAQVVEHHKTKNQTRIYDNMAADYRKLTGVITVRSGKWLPPA